MKSSAFELRRGRVDELALMVAIDDDACSLFVELGRDVNRPSEHDALMRAEAEAWRQSLEARRVVMAVSPEGEPVGFVSLGFVDSAAHLQQVSVRRSWMKRGVGKALMAHALGWAADNALWLTTYADIEWNRPYYERLGFSCVDETECGPEICRILEEERNALPAPEQRVAMCRRTRGRLDDAIRPRIMKP